jgi:hypothetical protein
LRTFRNASPAVLAVVELIAGISPATRVPRNTASTRPLTDRNAAFGLSASRPAAKIGDAPRLSRGSSRAARAVIHGPPTTRPTMMISRPGKAAVPIDL